MSKRVHVLCNTLHVNKHEQRVTSAVTASSSSPRPRRARRRDRSIDLRRRGLVGNREHDGGATVHPRRSSNPDGGTGAASENCSLIELLPHGVIQTTDIGPHCHPPPLPKTEPGASQLLALLRSQEGRSHVPGGTIGSLTCIEGVKRHPRSRSKPSRAGGLLSGGLIDLGDLCGDRH